MRIMVVGDGGREHALAWKLALSGRVETILCVPGNGGTAGTPKCTNYPAGSIDEQVQLAVDKKVDFVLIGPEQPLVAGMADTLREAGIPAVGPGAAAAKLEGSKAFAKDFMSRYGVNTAGYKSFHKSQLNEALQYLKWAEYPVVLKADGLAAGKGVSIHKTEEEAEATLRSLFEEEALGESGHTVVIEEYIPGREVSVIVLLDGTHVLPMLSAMDHKRIGENDTGANTGGMGAIAPNPFYTHKYQKKFEKSILIPTIEGIRKEGWNYRGALYFGIMMTRDEVFLLEYNVRFGDPETQVVVPLLKEDLSQLLYDLSMGRLDGTPLSFYDGAACNVVMASEGYPSEYQIGFPIQIDLPISSSIFIAGASEKEEKEDTRRLYTNGGRVLSVTGIGKTPREACREAYVALESIYFEGRYYRRDIGKL